LFADEKLKKQKNGNIHRYVYYGCSKAKDRDCKCGYLNEEDLVKQLQDMLDKISLDEIGMKDQIRNEVTRYNRFQKGILGIKGEVEVNDLDIRNYAKYILRDGRDYEKRELLGCLKSKVILKEKVITLV
jgi:hypothetical protein